jgi:hypothetical protein
VLMPIGFFAAHKPPPLDAPREPREETDPGQPGDDDAPPTLEP